ncbi:D-alanyl-D-alanine carboxypeptidase [Paenibacillus selenitireducens]|uniref:serine-type D-Ala-D-Ala carboxypeptidase n=1 Tax=Paenibacillus selenitireducens TaxID=1324314 RepID=A0A1T2XNC7_9BACL|nr:D-alanyl-D-alanine carboxypeptidase family protein [Paenibacillus selenitireducens]OPA81379.1 D-alanyl-D-alanine carboxypeptidase [Paenibacillus selenitireducens]
MRKGLLTWVCILLVSSIAVPWTAYAEPKAPATEPSSAVGDLAANAKSAVLMDADTGTVIFEKKSHDRLPPASITKIMTMVLVMEAIDQGKLKLTDPVQTSEYAASMGGSQIFLEQGEVMTVDEMLKGIAMASGNDASVAVAEKIAGTEESFVQMMNNKAKELGMKDTHFSNCNGLPVADHYTSAHDIALMSQELLKYNGITKYTGSYQDYLRKDSTKPFWLVNTNKLVRFYSGADGLKTGYTSEAKYCLSGTAKRDSLRMIAVVMGEPNTKTRNQEVTQMFDYAFSQYMNHPIFKSGDPIGTVKVEKGTVAELPIVAKQQYSVLLRKGNSTSEQIRHELVVPKNIKAPIQAGDNIGKLVVYQGDQVLKEFNLEASETIHQAGWWTLFKRTCSKLFFVD